MDVLVDVQGLDFNRRYRDTLTGFDGFAVAALTRRDGQVQVALAYLDTTPKEMWVEASRLEPIGERRAPGLAT